ncbi:MAG: signal recognition particle-docking protein FtsY [Nitrosomonas sp.]|nr:signal recognition particle-docking protein FtsY [Nitrosomonas sp.]
MAAYSIVWKKVTNLFKSVKNIFEKNEEFAVCQKELEALLISHDVNIKTAAQLVKDFPKSNDSDVVLGYLKQELITILSPCEKQFVLPDAPLAIALVCGVNGGGKTTTIAKLARYLRQDKKKIGFVAADTFRAAAIEQLQVWGKRLDVPVYAGPLNSDPASIIYQAIDWAKHLGLELLLVDTAGRLQNKKDLMDELAKIRRVIHKQIPDAPHETILVLDGTTGGNVITQTETFNSVTPLTGIIMTKLDGTAKGGGLVSLAALFKLPIYFLGIGEKETDLVPFSAEVFVDSLSSSAPDS